jgi:hypothetical protein
MSSRHLFTHPARAESAIGSAAAESWQDGREQDERPAVPRGDAPEDACVPPATQAGAPPPWQGLSPAGLPAPGLLAFWHRAPAPAAPQPPTREPQAKRPPRLGLSDWGVPAGVAAAFAARGVRKIFPWQAAALSEGARGDNLVYCAPTSGGKSLVAEVLMLRRLLRTAQQQRLPNGQLRPVRSRVRPCHRRAARQPAGSSTVPGAQPWPAGPATHPHRPAGGRWLCSLS